MTPLLVPDITHIFGFCDLIGHTDKNRSCCRAAGVGPGLGQRKDFQFTQQTPRKPADMALESCLSTSTWAAFGSGGS